MIRNLRYRISRDKKDAYIKSRRELNPMYNSYDDPLLYRTRSDQEIGWFGIESFIVSEEDASVALITKIFESNCRSEVHDVVLTYDELTNYFDVGIEGNARLITPCTNINQSDYKLSDPDVHFMINSPVCEDLRKEAYKRRLLMLEKKKQIEQQLNELNEALK